MSQKIILKVCRSCIVQNSQGDVALKDEPTLRETFEGKLKKGFLRGKVADLQIVDCLTNCENPNSVQIDRGDSEMLLGFIRTEKEVDELIRLVNELRQTRMPFAVSEALKEKLIFVRPHRAWRSGEDAFHADRIRRSSLNTNR